MEKINFKNLPSTEMPLNATNLNKMQDNIEAEFDGLALEHSTPENISTPGWYRVAKITGTGHPANTVILSISSSYVYEEPCSLVAYITTSWKTAKIELGPSVDVNNEISVLTKVRVQYDNTAAAFYVDVYYSTSSLNRINVKNENILKDKIEILTPTLVETEYTTVDEVPIVYNGRNGIETITNDNGVGDTVTAIKFPDGTMIVHGRKYQEGFTFKQWGNEYSADLDTDIQFPVAFIGIPHITITNTGSSAASIIRCEATTTKIAKISLARGSVSDGGYSFSYIAIGRWK